MIGHCAPHLVGCVATSPIDALRERGRDGPALISLHDIAPAANAALLSGMTNLTDTDWLNHGLQRLASDGAEALKADRLAKSLGVSRGSFYWHFADIAAYRIAVLDLWATRTTLAMAKRLDRSGAGADRLGKLLTLAMGASPSLERAVRSWATHDADAAKAVRGVDVVRLRYLRVGLVDTGVAPDEAEARASLLYLAYIGRVMTDGPAAAIDERTVRYIADLMTA